MASAMPFPVSSALSRNKAGSCGCFFLCFVHDYFLQLLQRYAVIRSPLSLPNIPPSSLRRCFSGPFCHHKASLLHTFPWITSFPQKGQFKTIHLRFHSNWLRTLFKAIISKAEEQFHLSVFRPAGQMECLIK